jgi:pilus assembly protein CpaF
MSKTKFPHQENSSLNNSINDSNIISRSELNNYKKNQDSKINSIGELSQLLEIKGITDIVINGPNDVWIDKGNNLEKVSTSFNEISTIDKLREYAYRLAALSNERLDESKPIVDSKLNNGIRLHAVLPPISNDFPYISLRVPSKSTILLQDLYNSNSIHKNWRNFLQYCIDEKFTMMISGSTGSGKTTLLKAIVEQIPKNERIICIEETREIDNINHPHYISLSTKKKNIEGRGEVELDELVRATLRMRPDRILLGEVRGKEILDLIMAFNTGHNGGLCSIHSNSLDSLSARIQSLASLSNFNTDKIETQIKLAFDVFLHMKKINNKRYLSEIGIPVIDDSGKLQIELLASLDNNSLNAVHSMKFNHLLEMIENKNLSESQDS